MADRAMIGALRVVLGADTAAFEAGLAGAQKTLAKFGAALGKAGTALGLGMTAAAAVLGVAIKGAINDADKLGKMSQSFGVPVEQLSALKHAADLSGVSMEEVGKSVGRLSRAMSEIAGGKDSGAAAEAFRALGLSVKNSSGQLKSSTEVMDEIADKFAGMQDGAGKTALAIAIFGRSGANMIPMLNQGAAGLREAREEAEALGLIVDTKTAKAAEAFNDNLTRLHRVLSGVALRVAAELSPALQLLTNQFVQSAKDGSIVRVVSETIVGGFQKIAIAAGAVPIALEGVTSSLVRMAQMATALLSFNPFTFVQMLKNLNEEGAKTEELFAANRRQFQDWNEQAKMLADHFGNAATAAGKVAAPVLAGANALDEFFKSQAKAIATQQADAMAVSLSTGARERLRLVMQAETIARENNIRMTDAQRIKVTELGNEMETAVLQQRGYNLLLESAEPHEKFRLEMQQNEQALRSIGATSGQVAAVQKMTAEKFGATWEQVTASAAGGFAQLATEMGKSNVKMAGVAKAFGIVEATINTYVAFTKALASFAPPLNYLAAAGVLAAGMAKVMAIKAQTVPKMATGGSFMVPGGVSGVDNRMMSLNLAAGERVTVEPAMEVSRASAGTVRPVTLVGDFFSREMVVTKLFPLFKDAQRDGYTLAPA